MHRTIRLIPEAHGTPVALQNADGEWVEVGYVSDLEFTLDEADFLTPGPPWRPYREYTLDLQVQGTERVYSYLKDLINQINEMAEGDV